MFGHLIIIIFKSIFRFTVSFVNFFYFGYFRPMYKKVLHILTGQCEIERIFSSSKLTMAAKIRKLELALVHSKRHELRKVLEIVGKLKEDEVETKVDDLAKSVVEVKAIPEGDRRQWLQGEIAIVLRMIAGYRFLTDSVEVERAILYDTSNPEHEELLLKLWSLLKPGEELRERVSYQWTEIGFQGEDPATDFRGMGILGLRQLVYFSEFRSDRALQLLSKSNHPTKGYPFAIVGISMTALARDLLREGALRNHFFNTSRRAAQMEDFHRLYCELFSIFDCFWTRTNPESIMEFVPLRHKFQNALRNSLSGEEAILQEIEGNEAAN